MTTYRIAVIGGTGPQGKGLGYRWARHGHTVVLGSRAAERAEAAAAEIRERAPGARGDAVRRTPRRSRLPTWCCWRCRTTGTTRSSRSWPPGSRGRP